MTSPAARLAFRYVAQPLVFTGIAWAFLPHHMDSAFRAASLGVVFVAAAVLLNTRVGRMLSHAFFEGLRVMWERVAAGILADVGRWVLHSFQQMLERFDRVLYEVDEWLRFRHGQGKVSLAVKASLGLVWFYIEYAARFVINLLVEPQINPLKHFPVVTVSHKIILPTEPLLAGAFEKLGMTAGRANAIAFPIVFVIPGMFGFLAWELKENWKLYAANRPRALKPVQVGSHGESLARLLRPGFHSGTVPKIFARLRRLQSREADGRVSALSAHGPHSPQAQRKAHRQMECLEHVREAVVHFLRREAVALLDQHPAWRGTPVSVGAVRLGATRIDVELKCPGAGAEPAWVSFEQWSGRIVAGVSRAGWTGELPRERADSLVAALVGLYRMAGVDLVREQVDSLFGPLPVHWDVRGEHLVVWPDDHFAAEAKYDLGPGPLVPQADGEDGTSTNGDAVATAAPAGLPVLEGRKLLLPLAPVEWDAWVRAWEPASSDGAGSDGSNGSSPDGVNTLPPIRVLPLEQPDGESESAVACPVGAP